LNQKKQEGSMNRACTMAALLATALGMTSCTEDAFQAPAAARSATLMASHQDSGGLAATASTTADFNGDGTRDLAVLSGSGSSAVVAVYTSAQVTGAPAGESYAVSPTAADVAAGDFNQDGAVDLAIAIKGSPSSNPPEPGRVSILFRNTTGGVKAQVDIMTGLPATRVIAADVNGDGRLDLVAQGGTVCVIAPAVGGGSFGAVRILYDATVPVSGDFNGDFRQDIAVVSASSPGTVQVYHWDSFDGAPAPAATIALGVSVDSLGARDLDGDGLCDLVAGTADGLRVLISSGAFSFKTPIVIGAGDVCHVAIGDLNGDGKLDLGYCSGASITLAHGDGLGGFTFSSSLSLSGDDLDLDTDDIDGDGRADLIVTLDRVDIYTE
jgi:hypothetical protein